ncbi:MAG: thioredoxin family protein [Candidatus Cloacimonetes bacterium]|nr:thioredoxin family protein [Candidatus Cloacimonadota bacterium]MDD3577423.1 thioredoxin family protein [Candidatus Cloacimonadota bacterium]
MRYILLTAMILFVAVLGCTPVPKEEVPSDPQIENTASNSDDYVPGTWIENWDLAIASAKELNRPVLVNFTGSDWCIWCIRLSKEVFTKDEFIDYAKNNLVLLKLDFPHKLQQSAALKQQNDTLAKQFGIQGYPTIVLVNQEGKEIQRTGYQPDGAAKYVEHLQEILSEQSVK